MAILRAVAINALLFQPRADSRRWNAQGKCWFC